MRDLFRKLIAMSKHCSTKDVADLLFFAIKQVCRGREEMLQYESIQQNSTFSSRQLLTLLNFQPCKLGENQSWKTIDNL